MLCWVVSSIYIARSSTDRTASGRSRQGRCLGELEILANERHKQNADVLDVVLREVSSLKTVVYAKAVQAQGRLASQLQLRSSSEVVVDEG